MLPFDGEDFNLVVAENGAIADRLADQRARDSTGSVLIGINYLICAGIPTSVAGDHPEFLMISIGVGPL